MYKAGPIHSMKSYCNVYTIYTYKSYKKSIVSGFNVRKMIGRK